MTKTGLHLAVATASITLGGASPAAAQSFPTSSTPERGVWMEATRTRFRVLEVDLPSTVWFMGGRMPLGARLALVADLPCPYARVGSSAPPSRTG